MINKGSFILKSVFKKFKSFQVFLMLFLISDFAWAQEDSIQFLDFSGYRVYTSIAAAKQNPDSVFVLDLSKKKLSEIPPEVFQFKNLKKLNISKNKIKELPVEIGQLTSLLEFDASSNNLKTIPASVGNLTKLKRLKLNRNLIEKLPPETGKLINLELIEMWDNELEGLPEEIRNLRNLKVLELRGIMFEQDEQDYIQNLLPDTKIYFSPPCNCAMKF